MTVVTGCQILRLKCIKFDFCWRSPDPLAAFKGPTSKGIRYDTRCYINVRSKANMSQLNLPHATDN